MQRSEAAMNAEVRQMKSAAELALADAYALAKPALPGGGKVAALREDAFQRFDASGLPHRRVEEWKYTDLRALMRDAKPLATPPDAPARALAKDAGKILGDIEARRLVFVDGAFVRELSDVEGLEPGLRIGSMAQALAAGDPLITTHLGRVVPGQQDVALALNTAFMNDGALIHVAAGIAVERPLHLVFVASGTQPASIFARSLVVIEQGARVMLVETHEGFAGRDYQVNAALELVVGDDAHVDHVKVTAEGPSALHVATLIASIGAHARFNAFTFTTGGAVVRNQLFVRFAGEGTLAGIGGVTLLRGRQHADTTLIADHAAASGQSREMFKSVLDEKSRGVFQGKIIVRPHAQKTDAKMATHALLLSDDAEADNKPELEIFADDVQCGHGATAGALDDDLLFYLKARGLPAKEAASLLIQAFVGEAIEGIEHAGLREALMEAAAAWLAARE
jgi:Fe-S cluster assembly protein SufD